MPTNQPYFRFNPNAYEEGRCFEKATDTCDICQRPCGWKYTGSIYAAQTPVVCAGCISNGNLARFIGDEHFSLHDIELSPVEPGAKDELFQRTPRVAYFNPFNWPVVDAKPLQFVGYGEDALVLTNTDAQMAIKEAFGKLEWEFEFGTPTSYALVFKEIEGSRYVAVIDLD